MRDGRRILFLEDNQDRINEFEENYSGVSYVKTPDDCIQKLLTGKFDKVYLDFDLDGTGNKGFNFDNPDNGGEVVKWLESLRVRGMFSKNLEVVIHSHNVPMSNEMLSRLQGAGYQKVKRRMFGMGDFWSA